MNKPTTMSVLAAACVTFSGLATNASADETPAFQLHDGKPVIAADLTHTQPASTGRTYIYRICRYTKSSSGGSFTGDVEIYRTIGPITTVPSSHKVAVLNNERTPCRDILINQGEVLILKNNNGAALATYNLVSR